MAGYDYVNRTYGCQFHGGERVIFTEDGRRGHIVRRRRENKYVRVRFEDGHLGHCHPNSLQIDTSAARGKS